MSITNLLIATLLITTLLALYVPLGKLPWKMAHNAVNKIYIALLFPAAVLGIVVLKHGLGELLYIILSLYILWIVVFGFLANRRYTYLLALLFLLAAPTLILIGLTETAEYLGVLCFICLTAGISKDILLDEIVDQGTND